jgi:hypothetical protein
MGKLVLHQLVDFLQVDVGSGEIRWKIKPALKNNVSIGDIAGTINDSGYRIITYKGYKYRAHTIVWFVATGRMPAKQLDHKNRKRSDNRIDNLREATTQQNGFNRDLQSNNKSGYSGVSRDSKSNRWRVRIKIDGEEKYLGSFDTKEQAAREYNRAAIHYFGEFASLNVIG